MRFTYSPKADALAVELTLDGRATGSKRIAPDTTADLDAGGRLIAIEVLNASAHYPKAELERLDSPVQWLTLTEAEKESGLAVSTLKTQIGKGKLEATKQGRDWMVARHELMTYLENRAPSGKPARRRRARRPKGAAKVSLTA